MPDEKLYTCPSCGGDGLLYPNSDRKCLSCEGRKKLPRERVIILLAKEQHLDEGTLEVDDNAVVSEGDDNGCYVQAWVWVDFSDTELDKEAEGEASPN